MTVGELIERLREYDPSLNVLVYNPDRNEYIGLYDVDEDDGVDNFVYLEIES